MILFNFCFIIFPNYIFIVINIYLLFLNFCYVFKIFFHIIAILNDVFEFDLELDQQIFKLF